MAKRSRALRTVAQHLVIEGLGSDAHRVEPHSREPVQTFRGGVAGKHLDCAFARDRDPLQHFFQLARGKGRRAAADVQRFEGPIHCLDVPVDLTDQGGEIAMRQGSFCDNLVIGAIGTYP